MYTLQDTNITAEQFFLLLEENKDKIQNEWNFLTEALNDSLARQDYDSLFALIPHIEQGEGSILLQCAGEVHRLLRILHIIKLECKYQKDPFCLNCMDKNSMMEKFMLTLFAYRRLQFKLSVSSMEEAVIFLRNNILSPIAAYMITQNELLIPDKALYSRIQEIYSDVWTEDDRQLFSTFILSSLP